LSREITAGPFGSSGILPSENGKRFVGLGGLLQSHANGGTHAAGGASANRVYYHQGRTRLRFQSFVDGLGRAQFFDSQAG
jgi:hypothetical protein